MKRASLLSLAFLMACGGGSTTTDTDAGTVTPGTDAPVPPGTETRSVSFPPHTVEVGGERTVCVVMDLGNEVQRQARAVRALLPTGSHHMIIYRTTEPLDSTPSPCSSFESGTAILGVQTPTAELVYPDEAGFTLYAHQHIRLEIHEVNYTTAPIDVTGTVEFELYPLDEPERAEVVHLFTGNTSLHLPAHETTTITSFHAVPEGARIIGMASHTHSLGIYASIHRATSVTEYTDLLHESSDWASPPFSSWTPSLVLEPGEGLRLECQYENTTDNAVSFGLDFADEMCFLGAYYY